MFSVVHVFFTSLPLQLDRLCLQHMIHTQNVVPAPLHYGGVAFGRSGIFGHFLDAPSARTCRMLNKGAQFVRQTIHSVFGMGMWSGLPFCGFPRSVCISVNDQVCHGIPNDYTKLKLGDIVNIDVTVIEVRQSLKETFCLFFSTASHRKSIFCVSVCACVGLLVNHIEWLSWRHQPNVHRWSERRNSKL